MTDPIKVEITLDLDRHLARFVGYNQDGEPIEGQTTLEDVVVGEAARQIVERVIHQTGDEIGELRRRVRDIRDETIRARIAPLIDEALVLALQPTNSYGEPTGEPVTLRALIVKEAERYLREPADRGDSYRNPKKLNPVRKTIEDEVDRAMKKELQTAVAEAKAEVVAAVREQGAKVLAETIVSMAGRP